MSEEADAHASGWKRLLELTDGGAVGALFDHPYEIRQDLAGTFRGTVYLT